ncbi:MAG: glycosyltransferase family 2 protein, partial [Acidobacteriota bacterium]|nr:glycosyltransferase family 2 protein [Acidobacteriota bacterium]
SGCRAGHCGQPGLRVILALALFFLAVGLVNAVLWPRVRKATGIPRGTLSVLIPARNEERNIGECLASVLAQGEIVSELLIYNDHSTDRTEAVVRASGDVRVHLLQPAALPEGWFGKSFACARLAEAAHGEWLLFLDADARLEPDACSSMILEAQRRGLTFLSPWPRFEMETFAERLLMPMLNFVVFSLFPAPLSLTRPDVSLGLAHGACILVKRETYNKTGGHSEVREDIFEDTRLAQLWRRCGKRGLCLDGRRMVRVRMYRSFSEIWRGFQKNFFLAFRHESRFWAFLSMHFCVFLLPFLWWDLRAVLAVLSLRAVLAIRFGHPWWSVFLHPVAEVILIALGISSWRLSQSARGVEWKGRYYPNARA